MARKAPRNGAAWSCPKTATPSKSLINRAATAMPAPAASWTRVADTVFAEVSMAGTMSAYCTEAYAENPGLVALVTAPFFTDVVAGAQASWRRVVVAAAQAGIPSPAFSSSLAYYDGLRADRLPAALVQGQRDFFGAHTYQRVDRPGTFHTAWAGDLSESEQ